MMNDFYIDIDSKQYTLTEFEGLTKEQLLELYEQQYIYLIRLGSQIDIHIKSLPESERSFRWVSLNSIYNSECKKCDILWKQLQNKIDCQIQQKFYKNDKHM